jgi:hypothetical protein
MQALRLIRRRVSARGASALILSAARNIAHIVIARVLARTGFARARAASGSTVSMCPGRHV